MDRIKNESEVNGPPMPMEMEIETTDNSLPLELEEKATNAEEHVDKVLCHKCGAWILAKNAQDARLTLWGHPAECWLFGISCKAFSANDCGEETDNASNIVSPQRFSPNNYEEETDCAAYDIHHNSKYIASKVPTKLMAQALLDSGVPFSIIQSKHPVDMSPLWMNCTR